MILPSDSDSFNDSDSETIYSDSEILRNESINFDLIDDSDVESIDETSHEFCE